MARFNQSLYAAVYYHTCCTIQDDEGEDERDDGGTVTTAGTTVSSESFVAINAWNEWAEGMSMEPSDVYGHGFLEVVQNVKNTIRQNGCHVGI